MLLTKQIDEDRRRCPYKSFDLFLLSLSKGNKSMKNLSHMQLKIYVMRKGFLSFGVKWLWDVF